MSAGASCSISRPMPFNPRSRRTVLLVSLVACAAVGLAAIYARRPSTGALPVQTEKIDSAATGPPPQVSSSTDDAFWRAFASAALTEVSQLDGTTTRGQWKALHNDDRP